MAFDGHLVQFQNALRIPTKKSLFFAGFPIAFRGILLLTFSEGYLWLAFPIDLCAFLVKQLWL